MDMPVLILCLWPAFQAYGGQKDLKIEKCVFIGYETCELHKLFKIFNQAGKLNGLENVPSHSLLRIRELRRRQCHTSKIIRVIACQGSVGWMSVGGTVIFSATQPTKSFLKSPAESWEQFLSPHFGPIRTRPFQMQNLLQIHPLIRPSP